MLNLYFSRLRRGAKPLIHSIAITWNQGENTKKGDEGGGGGGRGADRIKNAYLTDGPLVFHSIPVFV